MYCSQLFFKSHFVNIYNFLIYILYIFLKFSNTHYYNKLNSIILINIYTNKSPIMKKLSPSRLADTVVRLRKQKSMTQAQLGEATGINRALISRIEQQDFVPSIEQLENLGYVLDFDITELFTNSSSEKIASPSPLNIAVAGTGYVGLSIATLLAQHNHVTAVDIIPEKVDLINQRKSPIQDEYIEQYLAKKELDLTATLDGETAYKNVDFVVIAAPTNYDSQKNYFDTSAVEAVIELVLKVNPDAIMVIKSTIPVGYTESVRKKYDTKNIIFSPEFLPGNPKHCTTICIQAVSLYLLTKMIQNL